MNRSYHTSNRTVFTEWISFDNKNALFALCFYLRVARLECCFIPLPVSASIFYVRPAAVVDCLFYMFFFIHIYLQYGYMQYMYVARVSASFQFSHPKQQMKRMHRTHLSISICADICLFPSYLHVMCIFRYILFQRWINPNEWKIKIKEMSSLDRKNTQFIFKWWIC